MADELFKDVTEDTTPALTQIINHVDPITGEILRHEIQEFFANLGLTVTINGTLTSFAGMTEYFNRITQNASVSLGGGVQCADFRNTSNTGNGVLIQAGGASGTRFMLTMFDHAGVLKAQVARTGGFESLINSYGAISDLKLKKLITDANSQWDDIKAIKLKNYVLKNDEENNVQLGVIAQDLEGAGMNGLVYEKEDVELVDGVEKDLGTKTKAVKYSVLYLKAIGALQEAMKKIEDLETRVKDLEA